MVETRNGLAKLGEERTGIAVVPDLTIPLKMISLNTTLAHPVKANVDVILEPCLKSGRYRNYPVLIPDTDTGMFDLIGNISSFRDAVIAGQDELQGLILYVDYGNLEAIKRILNREALPETSRTRTLAQLLALYDEGGPLFYARNDDGSREGLITFLAETLIEDEREVRMVADLYWLDRDDLITRVSAGNLSLYQAHIEALADEDDNDEELSAT